MTGPDLGPAGARWHPPRWLLELAELVVTGALDALPEDLALPTDVAARARAGGVLLEDAEGTPVALLGPDGVSAALPFTHPPLRSQRRTPAEVRELLAALDGPTTDAPVGLVPVAGSLTCTQVASVLEQGRGGRLLWLALVGDGRRLDLPPEGLFRAVRAAAAEAAGAGVPSLAVPVAIPSVGEEVLDAGLEVQVGAAMGAGELVVPPVAEPGGEPHPAFGSELERALQPAHRGVTVFFTGLSGSGKSTVARALAERIATDGERTTSLLDGDEVRRLLSAGLGFSRADRDLNIRRVGFVATEVSRHGGLAICAPIAPFAQARAEVRAAVEEVGDFVLVHISTPLAECERRDRKGLYARARQGLIPEFTGISSPYEPPTDADLTLDTSAISVPDAVQQVHGLLLSRGYLAGR